MKKQFILFISLLFIVFSTLNAEPISAITDAQYDKLESIYEEMDFTTATWVSGKYEISNSEEVLFIETVNLNRISFFLKYTDSEKLLTDKAKIRELFELGFYDTDLILNNISIKRNELKYYFEEGNIIITNLQID